MLFTPAASLLLYLALHFLPTFLGFLLLLLVMTVLLPDSTHRESVRGDSPANSVLHVHFTLENHTWTGCRFQFTTIPQTPEQLFAMLAHTINMHYRAISEQARTVVPPADHLQLYTTNLGANLGKLFNHPNGIVIDFTPFTRMDNPLRVVLIPYHPGMPFHNLPTSSSSPMAAGQPSLEVEDHDMKNNPARQQQSQVKEIESLTPPKSANALQPVTQQPDAPFAQPGGQSDLNNSPVIQPILPSSMRGSESQTMSSKVDLLSNDVTAQWAQELGGRPASVHHEFGQGLLDKTDSVGRDIQLEVKPETGIAGVGEKIVTDQKKEPPINGKQETTPFKPAKQPTQQQAKLETSRASLAPTHSTTLGSTSKSTTPRANASKSNSGNKTMPQARSTHVSSVTTTKTSPPPAVRQPAAQIPILKQFDTLETTNILLVGPKGGGKTDVVKIMASFLAGRALDKVLGAGPIKPTAMHKGDIAQYDLYQYRVFEVPSFDGIKDRSELENILSFCSSLPRVSAIVVVVDGSECYRENSVFSKFIFAQVITWMLTSHPLNAAKHAIINPKLFAVYTHCEDELSVRLQWKTFGDTLPEPALTIHLDNVFFAPDNNIAVLMFDDRLRPKLYEKWDASETSLAKLFGAIVDSVEMYDAGLANAEQRRAMVIPAGCGIMQLLNSDVVRKYFQDLSGPYENMVEDTIDRVVASMRPKDPVFGEDGKLTVRGRGIQNRSKALVDKHVPPSKNMATRVGRSPKDLWQAAQKVVMDASLDIANTYKTGQKLRAICNNPVAMRQHGTVTKTADELIQCADRIIVYISVIAVACARVANLCPKDIAESALEIVQHSCERFNVMIADGDAQYAEQLASAINRRAAHSGGAESLFTLLCAEIPSEDVINQAVREGMAILSQAAVRIESIIREKEPGVAKLSGVETTSETTPARATSPEFPGWQMRGEVVASDCVVAVPKSKGWSFLGWMSR